MKNYKDRNSPQKLSALAKLQDNNTADPQEHHALGMNEIRLDYDCYCFRYFNGVWGVEAYYVVTTGTPNPNSYDMKSHLLTANVLQDLVIVKDRQGIWSKKEQEALDVLACRNGGYPSKRPASYYIYAPPFNRL